MNLPNVYVAQSPIHGRGLFAGQTINEGVRVIEFAGDVVTKDEFKERFQQYEAEGNSEIYYMDLDEIECYIDGTINGNDARYVNHSCEVS